MPASSSTRTTTRPRNPSGWRLLNGYVDVGTWHGITPFLGAGVGAANVKISNFTDIGVANDSVAFGDDHDEWNFAWAVYAGLGFEVTEAFTVELAYRYLDIGDGEIGRSRRHSTAPTTIDNPMRFNGHHLARCEARRALHLLVI